MTDIPTPSPKEKKANISIIVPALNEEETLEGLVDGIVANLPAQDKLSYEIIFVDDGSTDQTWPKMQSLAQSHDCVRAIRLRRHYGKAAAISTGFERSSGQIIITMDADLQDDPSEIPKLLTTLDTGFDLVNGWKQVRHDPLSKTFPSKIFNGILNSVFRLPLHDINCGFKVAKRGVFEDIPLYGELHRFIPVLADHMGYKVTETPVQHHPRRAGKSKYGFERFLRGLIDMVTVYTLTRYRWRPGHLFSGLGLLIGLIGIFLSGLLLIAFSSDNGLSTFGGALILAYLSFASGVILFGMGIISEFGLFRSNRASSSRMIAEEK